MERKTTIKEFFTTKFWRITGGIIAVCLLILTCYVGKTFYDEEFGPTEVSYMDTYLHGDLWYHHRDGCRSGYVFNEETGKRLLKGIDWIALSEDDSLAVFAKGRKRGYFNTHTGKVVIPPTFTKAWVFSDGLAAVMMNDTVFFIDHEGKQAFSYCFPYTPDDNGYCFHNGYFQTQVGDKYGVIDKQGNWVMEPEFDFIYASEMGYWEVSKDEHWGICNPSFQMIFPCEYKSSDVTKAGIFLSSDDNVRHLYNFDGTLLNDFVIEGISPCMYSTDERDDDGDFIQKAANCYSYYTCGYHYGLMNKNGHRITPPIYSSIEAISADLYLCSYEGSYNDGGILLNSRGEKVE